MVRIAMKLEIEMISNENMNTDSKSNLCVAIN